MFSSNRYKTLFHKKPNVVKRLNGPFIKIEDRSRRYRPYVCEFKKWPQINIRPGRKQSCIFAADSPSKTTSKKREDMVGRYCELCDVYATNLDEHLDGELHKKTVQTTDFSSLDAEIASGTTLEQFIEKIMKESNEEEPPKQLEVQNQISNESDEEEPPMPVEFRKKTKIRVAKAGCLWLLIGQSFIEDPELRSFKIDTEGRNSMIFLEKAYPNFVRVKRLPIKDRSKQIAFCNLLYKNDLLITEG